jgi:pyruvate/2-oxoglutarate dehydrogenase complex dihydrolipoamide dehydrogenase (E3) component
MCTDSSPTNGTMLRDQASVGALPVGAHRSQPTPAGAHRLLIVGGGLAGTVAAREAARRGVRAALVFPAADRAESPRPTPLTEQIRRLQARMGQVEPLQPPAEPGIDVVVGQAVFCQRHALVVGGRELHFRKALVTTGARPAPVAIDGADPDHCLQVETLGQLTELPSRLAVIGDGSEACVWAQAFRRFGSQVHLISRQNSILPQEEPEAAALLQARFQQEGIRLDLGCLELAIEATGHLQAVVIGRDGRKQKLLVDRVLLCGPRQPNFSGLGLEAAGVAYSDHGIVVGDRLQTTNRHIFAAGGVCGAEFATPHAAEATARLAVHNALSFTNHRLSRLVIPCCIYTDPAIARVGLTPRQAASKQIEIDTYRADLPLEDEVLSVPHRQGLIAVHVRRRSGALVGATVVAEAADQLIAPLLLLMTRRWSLVALADVIACRPGRFELLTRLGERCRQDRGWRFGTRLIERWRAWREQARRR